MRKNSKDKRIQASKEQESIKGKSKSGKKPYAIECRMIRAGKEDEGGWISNLWKDWRLYKRYATEKDRDKALEGLRKSALGFQLFKMEYRIPPEEQGEDNGHN